MLQNEYISIDIRTAGRRFAGVTVQDRINGRSYELGKDIFTLQLQEARTDEACSKKEYTDTCFPLCSSDLMCGELTVSPVAADAAARRLVDRRAGMRASLPFAVTTDGYKLEWFAVHTSNMTTSTSVVRLSLDGQIFEEACSGDGPVDAALEAIDRIVRPVDHSFDVYRISGISPGKDTMGEVTVKLTCDDRTFTGRGLHTNIVEASVRAYLRAMNKMRAYTIAKAKEGN